MTTYRIKDWFQDKLAEKFEKYSSYGVTLCCGIKETEKAIYGIICLGYMYADTPVLRTTWIPKSCLENAESVRFIPDYEEAMQMCKIYMKG